MGSSSGLVDRSACCRPKGLASALRMESKGSLKARRRYDAMARPRASSSSALPVWVDKHSKRMVQDRQARGLARWGLESQWRKGLRPL